MAGQVLQLLDIIRPDNLGVQIARYQYEWHMLRQNWIADMDEIRRYIFATDTTKTTNSKLPWKNKTTIPKMCQIRDNLNANYLASLFPKKKWLRWDALSKDSNTKEKIDSITSYMGFAIEQSAFKDEMAKCLLDYIDYGNCFAMPVWIDESQEVQGASLTKTGYVGPGIRRISPIDIVFNPIAPDFAHTPKIVRSIVSIGEVKDMLDGLANDDNRAEYEEIYRYLKDVRQHVQGYGGELNVKDNYLNVDGFTSYQLYLKSNYCEILTFYGDIYDEDNDTFQKNRVIMVVDRHKVISNKPSPSYLATGPIVHCGWRKRQDNLWAMGPLNNLVGMQYRIDHVENLKADCFDLIVFPPLKIKGYVDDFEWGPMARIYIGDNDGDVEMMAPEWNVLTANTEIQYLITLMEEMAGSPKEAMGFRTPGEKTKYEVERMENAASRIFRSKTAQLEEFFEEPLLNGMLEMGKRKATTNILVRYFDDEMKINKFMELTPEDISGAGRIRPYASRHFSEQAEMVQNLTQLFGSPIGQMIGPHFSTLKMAQLFEDLMDLGDYKMVLPFVQLAEQADAQKFSNALVEQVLMEGMTSAGISPDDVTPLPQGGQASEMGASPGQPGMGTPPPGPPQAGPF